MGKCHKCNVEIVDETQVCPLCHSVLERTYDVENMYPNARVRVRSRLFFSRVYLFVGLLIEAMLVSIDMLYESPIWWSAITGLGIFYGYLVLRYAIIGKSGYRSKVIVLSMIAVLSAIAIDFIIGFRGWSLDYVLPAGILLMDVIILGCMAFNRRNWQSYIMWQILMVLLSGIPILLNFFELENNRFLAFAPMSASLVIFVGTMIIGGRRAWVEVRRRFHLS